VTPRARAIAASDLPSHRPVVAPNFSLEERAAGILLHITSLPGPHGNGDLGPEARAFVEFLARAGQRWWQMLPVNPVGPGNSPYSGVSAFAGSPLFIDLRGLVDEGLLDADDVAQELPRERADYVAATELRTAALRKAFTRFRERGGQKRELEAFRTRASYWLDDYALFMALKRAYDGAAWTAFSSELARREPAALDAARKELAAEVQYFEFEQFVFDRQWRALRMFAAERGVGLIGDAPIFIAHDSSDVWANQSMFRLDEGGEPTHVSGVPPDYFSKTGQRWGTPLYRWKALQRRGYPFWVERFRTLMERFDVIRLDHFIGFARYWEIPVEEQTAIHGRWMKGPGSDLFEVAARELGTLPFIAEDLGLVTRKVTRLRDRHHMPGMRVMQFGFGGDTRENDFLPHRYVRNCVAYTGTHDNDTAVGWYEDDGEEGGVRSPEQAESERRNALLYLQGPLAGEVAQPIHWLMLRALYASVANTAILPLQDVLGLGSDARMNTPGQGEGNWEYRVDEAALSEDLARTLRSFTATYGRLCPDQSESE
jgi:4-alpha-glucanotransferase